MPTDPRQKAIFLNHSQVLRILEDSLGLSP
jgi:hypothetical protein